VAHKGSPFRIAILDEEETVRMVLLDHIPHWDEAAAMPYVEKSYVKYHITLDIPDVKCEKVCACVESVFVCVCVCVCVWLACMWVC
jgi:hypothetical protein